MTKHFSVETGSALGNIMLWGNIMSQDLTNTDDKEVNLPQFINDEKEYISAEDENSWLSNNLHKLMLIISVIWILLVAVYITQFFGWSNLFLMMPDEFGGFMAGITLPLVIFWVAMAYIDRGTSFKTEAKFLRAYMNQLVCPNEGAPQTVKAMADAIRSQVIELQEVSKLAHEQTSRIKDSIKENVDDFSQLVGKLDNYSSHTIVELSDGVKFLMSNFENIVNQAQKSSDNLTAINHQFIEDSAHISDSLTDLLAKLVPSMQNIRDMVTELRQTMEAMVGDMNKSNNEFASFNQMVLKNFNDTQTVFNTQIEALGQVSERAFDNCEILKNQVADEVMTLQNSLQNHYDKVSQATSSIVSVVKHQSDEMANTIMSNMNNVNQNIRREVYGAAEMFSEQVDKFDQAIAKYNGQIDGLLQSMDNRSNDVCKKISSQGEILSQELEKLMIRSSNLEDGVAMRVANLSGIADKTMTSMQDIQQSLINNMTTLSDKVAAANDDINSYITNLGDRTADFASLSDKVANITGTINERYNQLHNAMNSGLEQLQNVDREINYSSDNLAELMAQSMANVQQASETLKKQASGLTETASIVVTQSQIGEGSLAQQQKYITDTASKIEFIKDELRRQIDELALASEEMEKSAITVSDSLKNNVQRMLGSCKEAVDNSKIANANLIEQADQFDTSINKTMTKITQFEKVINKQMQNIDVLSKKVDTRSDNIGKNIDECVQKLDNASNLAIKNIDTAVSDFMSKADQINNVSQTAADYITNVSDTIDSKVVSLDVMFRKQEADFYAYSNKMADNTTKMVDIIKKQMTEVSADTDKMYAKMVEFEEESSNKADNVIASLQKSAMHLSEMGRVFEEQQRNNSQLVDNAIIKFENINNMVQEKMDGIAVKVKEIDENVSSSVNNMVSSSSQLKSLQNEFVKEEGKILHQFVEQSKNLETVYTKIQEQGVRIADSFAKQQNSISEVVNGVVTQARLGEASMAQQYKYLTDATSEVAAKMKAINNDFKNNTGEIFDVTNKMSYEFEVLGDRLLKACEAINKTSKDSIKNIDQVNLRMSQFGEDLDITIRQSIKNIGGVFQEYEKYLSGFNTITAETSTGVEEVGNLISAQSDKMVKISDDTKKLVDCFNTVLNDTSGQLAARANDAYEKVKDLGIKLKQLSNEMDDSTKLSATHLEKSGDKLRASVNEIAANAERISNNILASGEVFVKQSQALSALADSTADKVNISLNDLIEAGKKFEAQGASWVKRSSEFAAVVHNSMENMVENTTKAEDVLQKMSVAYHDIKVDAFIQDSTKIIRILESAAVDINRLIAPKGEEELWKKFYNGDTQVFVRALAKNISGSQIAGLRKAFEQNKELRSLVINYMNEFEALVEKSKNHEHAAVLMAVISGSDLGRLYYILSKALNKIN